MNRPDSRYKNNRGNDRLEKDKRPVRMIPDDVASTLRKGPAETESNPVLIQSIRQKKRRSRKRLLGRLKALAAVLLLVALFILSPIFRIRKVTVLGVKNGAREVLEAAAGEQSGRHILFYEKNQVLEAAGADAFVRTAEVRADLKGELLVTVEEYPADYAILNGGSAHILSREGRVLGTRVVIPEGAVALTDDTAVLPPGNVMYGDGQKKEFLTAFKRLMEQNASLIEFQQIDIRDPRNIILKSGEWQVELGEGKDLERKLNQAINILKEVEGREPGIIDLKFNAPPVIRQQGGI